MLTPAWTNSLKQNPLPGLREFGDPALLYFTRRDFLDDHVGDIEQLWDQPEVKQILTKQHPEGYWAYPGRGEKAHSGENYDLLQSYRMMGILIEKYGLNNTHPAIVRAAEYIFTHQSDEGDIRGIFGSQFTPHYTAGMLELLIKAGYKEDSRIKIAFQWFQNTRQTDGGWAWPLRSARVSYQLAIKYDAPVHSDYSKPFSTY